MRGGRHALGVPAFMLPAAAVMVMLIMAVRSAAFGGKTQSGCELQALLLWLVSVLPLLLLSLLRLPPISSYYDMGNSESASSCLHIQTVSVLNMS